MASAFFASSCWMTNRSRCSLIWRGVRWKSKPVEKGDLAATALLLEAGLLHLRDESAVRSRGFVSGIPAAARAADHFRRAWTCPKFGHFRFSASEPGKTLTLQFSPNEQKTNETDPATRVCDKLRMTAAFPKISRARSRGRRCPRRRRAIGAGAAALEDELVEFRVHRRPDISG